MFCEKCGKELPPNGMCPVCNQAQQGTYSPPPPVYQYPVTTNNTTLFSVLSYIGILWLLGLLINPDRHDPKVRFHVGQGIILSIFWVAIHVVIGIIATVINVIFRIPMMFMGSGFYGPSFIVVIITTLLWLATYAVIITLIVVGIVNAAKGEQKPLPLIGSSAFYK